MISRKAGRPLGGKLSEDDKKASVLRAREQQKKWRVENPERYAEHVKKYRESRNTVKEVSEFELVQKFIKRIKTISINEVLQPCLSSQLVS